MTDRNLLLRTVRKPTFLLSIVVGFVVILLWLFLFYFPYATKISNYDKESQTLLTEQLALNQQVITLQHTATESPELLAKLAEFSTLIPNNANPYPYITTIDNAAVAAGVSILGVTVPSAGVAVAGTQNITAIPIPLQTKGTYDATLAFIKSIYALPRLTSIDNITITGGNDGGRQAVLTVNYALTIYTTAPVAG